MPIKRRRAKIRNGIELRPLEEMALAGRLPTYDECREMGLNRFERLNLQFPESAPRYWRERYIRIGLLSGHAPTNP